MAKSPFITAANQILLSYKPRCFMLRFDPDLPFGQMQNDPKALNLGAVGALMLCCKALKFNEREVRAVLHDSLDRDKFWQWLSTLEHLVNVTRPNNPEDRALHSREVQKNGKLYRLLGLNTAEAKQPGDFLKTSAALPKRYP